MLIILIEVKYNREYLHRYHGEMFSNGSLYILMKDVYGKWEDILATSTHPMTKASHGIDHQAQLEQKLKNEDRQKWVRVLLCLLQISSTMRL